MSEHVTVKLSSYVDCVSKLNDVSQRLGVMQERLRQERLAHKKLSDDYGVLHDNFLVSQDSLSKCQARLDELVDVQRRLEMQRNMTASLSGRLEQCEKEREQASLSFVNARERVVELAADIDRLNGRIFELCAEKVEREKNYSDVLVDRVNKNDRIEVLVNENKDLRERLDKIGPDYFRCIMERDNVKQSLARMNLLKDSWEKSCKVAEDKLKISERDYEVLYKETEPLRGDVNLMRNKIKDLISWCRESAWQDVVPKQDVIDSLCDVLKC